MISHPDSSSKHDLSEVAARVFSHAEDISEIKGDLKEIRKSLLDLTAAELRREGARTAMSVGWGLLVVMAGALGWFIAHYKP